MSDRRDKLGRRIPEFDRSKAGVKGAKTQKEKYGPDFHKRTGASGGSRSKRGYFGYLKDEGREDELKALSKKAIKARKESKKSPSGISPGVRGTTK